MRLTDSLASTKLMLHHTRPAYLLTILLGVGLAMIAVPLCNAQRRHPGVKPKVAKPSRAGRATISLDGTWKFALDTDRKGEASEWPKSPPTITKDINVPSLWDSVGSTAPHYTGTAWYWRTIALPDDWKGQTIRLQLHAVAESCTVWMNGERLGAHSDGTVPFEFTVTKTAKIGAENLVALEVRGDAVHGSGIWQDVELVAHDEAYISDVGVQGDQYGRILADLSLLNSSTVTGDAEIDCKVSATTQPGDVVAKSLQNLRLTPGANVTQFFATIRKQDLHLWSPETPILYRYQLIFRQETDNLDTETIDIGCRGIGWNVKTAAVVLNGEDLKLSSVRLKGGAYTAISLAEEDKILDMLNNYKSAGTNLIYVEAANPVLLRLADKAGVMIVEGPRSGLTPAERDDEMRNLIRRDRNHPSIIGWEPGACSLDIVRDLVIADSTRFLIVTDSASKVALWAPGKIAPDPGPLPTGVYPR